LRHRPTGSIAGAVRLILSDPVDPATPFPLEANYSRQFGHQAPGMDGVPRQRIGEISRLLVARQFGSGQPGGAAPGNTAPTAVFPHPILGLLRAVTMMSAMNGVTHLYAMMEPQLNRLLRIFRLSFEPIGSVMECHGPRQPHMGALWQVLARTQRERPRAWEVVTDCGAIRPVESDLDAPLPCSAGALALETAAM
jgi:N-acyl amino acid synthase of PEP-CTERM/exosortase system